MTKVVDIGEKSDKINKDETEFERNIRLNKEKEERLKRDREKANKNVKRNYRLT